MRERIRKRNVILEWKRERVEFFERKRIALEEVGKCIEKVEKGEVWSGEWQKLERSNQRKERWDRINRSNYNK